MEINNYTKEKLMIHPKADGNIISMDSERVIANCNATTSNIRDEYSVNHNNAKRIVKCWNEYDKIKEERDLLFENLYRIVDRVEENNLDILFPSAYNRAKELLTTLKNKY